MTVYPATVAITPVGGTAFDVGCDVANVAINHGRADPGTQPEASTASISMPLGLVEGVEIGATVQVFVSVGAVQNPRFYGTVTDMVTEWETRYDPDHGDVAVLPVARIMAAGPLADTGRRYVGVAPWAQELDGARVSRILANIGVDTARVDPGTVQLLPRDVDRQAALGLMQDAANDAAGVVWQSKDGVIGYADAVHRHGEPVGLTLDACDVLMSPRWSRTRSGLVNDVAVTYGLDPGGSTGRPAVTATAPASVNTYGRMAYNVTTELAASADATALAQLLMVRNSQPVWLLDGIQVDLGILSASKTAALMALDIHSLVAITGFPSGGPVSAASLWVEGWTEDITADGHTMSLFVSAYCRTAPPPTWDELPPTWTWDTIETSTVRRNRVTNPRIGANLAGWVPYNGTNTRVTGQSGWAFGTATALRATFAASGAVPVSSTGVYTDPIPLTAAKLHGAAIQVRSNRPQRVGISLEFYDAADNYLGATWDTDAALPVVLTPNVVTTLVSLPYYSSVGAAYALLGVYPAPTGPGTGIVPWDDGDWLEVTNAHVEETSAVLTATPDPVTGIFHGAMTDTVRDDFAWTGAADASASTRTTPPPLIWDTVTCFGGPLPTYGRWADVPASLRWDAVDPATAWDEWEWIDATKWESYPATTTWDNVPDGSTWDIPPSPGS